MARAAQEEGVTDAETDLSQPVFYFSPRVTVERTLELLDASPIRLQMVLLETVQRPWVAFAMRLRSALRVPGAPWASVPRYNRVMRMIGRR
jgi:hypothetical protein